MIPPPRTQQSEWLNHITMRRVDELRVNVWLIRLAVAATKEVRLRGRTRTPLIAGLDRYGCVSVVPLVMTCFRRSGLTEIAPVNGRL